jgi:hypothetical protein
MEEQPSLYDKVIRITNVYLGPSTERFIGRQVRNHLHKEPEEISEKDLYGLIDWIKVAVSLLTEDSEIVEEYTEQLSLLVGNSKPNKMTHKKPRPR